MKCLKGAGCVMSIMNRYKVHFCFLTLTFLPPCHPSDFQACPPAPLGSFHLSHSSRPSAAWPPRWHGSGPPVPSFIRSVVITSLRPIHTRASMPTHPPPQAAPLPPNPRPAPRTESFPCHEPAPKIHVMDIQHHYQHGKG